MQHPAFHRLSATPRPSVGALLAKAKRLRESAYFVGTTDASIDLDRQLIFLVLAGRKPLAEVVSARLVPSGTGRRAVGDDPEAVGEFCDRLGSSTRSTEMNTSPPRSWPRSANSSKPTLAPATP